MTTEEMSRLLMEVLRDEAADDGGVCALRSFAEHGIDGEGVVVEFNDGAAFRVAVSPYVPSFDANRSGAMGYSTVNGRHPGTTLTDLTCRTGRQAPTTCAHGGECKNRLNPRFVEWLMGFPAGWTDVG